MKDSRLLGIAALWSLTSVGLIACRDKEPDSPSPKVAQIDGETIAKQVCGQCHLARAVAETAPPPKVELETKLRGDIGDFVRKHATTRAPDLEQLQTMSAGAIVIALERGTMAAIGAPLTQEQRIAIAEHLSGKKYEPGGAAGKFCASANAATELDHDSGWIGPGNGERNWRFQPAAGALSRDSVSQLKLKWAYALPEGRQGSAIESAGSRVFFGDTAGRVHSVDGITGCVHWVHATERWVRTALNVAKVDVGGRSRYVASFAPAAEPHELRAVDALTGELLWKRKILEQRIAISSNSPILHAGTLYVPISVANEHRDSMDPKYECCTARGAIVAVDVATGDVKWTGYVVPEPKPTIKNASGTQMYGPSGGSIWKPPTIDAKLQRIYVGTGENLSGPRTDTAGAIVAMNMADGSIAWSRRLADDVIFNGSCYMPWLGNCPSLEQPVSADASGALLVDVPGGGRLLVVANKHGKVWGLDPDKDGAIVWETRISQGGGYGGVQWSMATDGERVFVPYHDRHRWPALTTKQWKARFAERKGLYQEEDSAAGGLVALRVTDGKELWRAVAPDNACEGKKGCAKAFSSPPTVIPGVVFAASHDGYLRAFSADDGKVLWEFDTAREFDTVQGVKASGGGIDGPGGPIVADGMVFISSGYGAYGVMPGNVMLAFSVD
jgi:polyvinyl alcohol dehydrogenase (cytochrome)